MAGAFTTGRYGNFGTGEYGDLEATVAAVLLDEEATSLSLEADPARGKLREPLMKLMHLLRALEYQGVQNQLVRFRDLDGSFS